MIRSIALIGCCCGFMLVTITIREMHQGFRVAVSDLSEGVCHHKENVAGLRLLDHIAAH